MSAIFIKLFISAKLIYVHQLVFKATKRSPKKLSFTKELRQ